MEVASAHRDPDRVRDIVRGGGADLCCRGGPCGSSPGRGGFFDCETAVGVVAEWMRSMPFCPLCRCLRGIPVMAVTEENALSVADIINSWKGLEDKNPSALESGFGKLFSYSKALEEIQIQSGAEVVWCALKSPRPSVKSSVLGKCPE